MIVIGGLYLRIYNILLVTNSDDVRVHGHSAGVRDAAQTTRVHRLEAGTVGRWQAFLYIDQT